MVHRLLRGGEIGSSGPRIRSARVYSIDTRKSYLHWPKSTGLGSLGYADHSTKMLEIVRKRCGLLDGDMEFIAKYMETFPIQDWIGPFSWFVERNYQVWSGKLVKTNPPGWRVYLEQWVPKPLECCAYKRKHVENLPFLWHIRAYSNFISKMNIISSGIELWIFRRLIPRERMDLMFMMDQY